MYFNFAWYFVHLFKMCVCRVSVSITCLLACLLTYIFTRLSSTYGTSHKHTKQNFMHKTLSSHEHLAFSHYICQKICKMKSMLIYMMPINKQQLPETTSLDSYNVCDSVIISIGKSLWLVCRSCWSIWHWPKSEMPAALHRRFVH